MKDKSNEAEGIKEEKFVAEEAKIIAAIKNCVARSDAKVEITENYEFSQKDTINLIELYTANKFLTGDEDELGDKKYFINIVNPLVDNAAKNIDIDRKNIEVKPNKVKYRIPAAIYNDKLKQYLEDIKMGSTLNALVYNLPRYGSVILKYQKGVIRRVELRYFIGDPAINNEQDDYEIKSPFMGEFHYADVSEIRKMKGTGWNQKAVEEIDDIVEDRLALGASEVPNIKIVEMYMMMPNELFKEGEDGYDDYMVYALINDDGDDRPIGIQRVLYFKKGVKGPYKKVDWMTVAGRLLGWGILEGCFDIQERWNEMENIVASQQRTNGKQVYQTRDKNIAENVLTDLYNGEILKVQSEITPIDNSVRNIGDITAERSNLMDVARMTTGANEVSTGETMPSDTTYRTVQQLASATAKYFDMKREDLSLFLNDVFTSWVLPDFEKQLKKENIIDIMDYDLWAELVEQEAEKMVNKAAIDYVFENAKFPTQEEMDKEKEKIIARAAKDPEILVKKGYFDFEKKLFVDISGERYNSQRNVETKINAMTQIANNPTILDNPMTRALFESILEDTGVDIQDVRKAGRLDFKVTSQKPTGPNQPMITNPGEAARNQSMAPGGAESGMQPTPPPEQI